MPRNSHWKFSIKTSVLENFAVVTRKHLCCSLYLIKFFQHRCFPVNVAKFLRTPILKNICERLLLNVVFSSNGKQHMLVKLDEMGLDIIMFYIYSYYFGIIIFAFYPEAIVGGVLQKGVLKNFAKFARKRLYRSLFLNATSNFIQKKTPT